MWVGCWDRLLRGTSMHWEFSRWQDKASVFPWARHWLKLCLPVWFFYSGSDIKPNIMLKKGICLRSECRCLMGLVRSVCIYFQRWLDFTGKGTFLVIKHGNVRGLQRYLCSFDKEKRIRKKNRCTSRLWHFFWQNGQEKIRGLPFKFFLECEN